MWSLNFRGFENVDHELTDLIKVFRNNPCKETIKDLVEAESFNRIVTELFKENIENSAILVLSYIKSVSAMLPLVSSVRESD